MQSIIFTTNFHKSAMNCNKIVLVKMIDQNLHNTKWFHINFPSNPIESGAERRYKALGGAQIVYIIHVFFACVILLEIYFMYTQSSDTLFCLFRYSQRVVWLELTSYCSSKPFYGILCNNHNVFAFHKEIH